MYFNKSDYMSTNADGRLILIPNVINLLTTTIYFKFDIFWGIKKLNTKLLHVTIDSHDQNYREDQISDYLGT